MTISGDTICSVIQAFPVLLILAQNSNRCLKTPLIYHPPQPTHSPEYYEALDALFQTLYGHGNDHNHGHDDHGCDSRPGYQYHGDYGYGEKSVHKYYYNHKPCHHKPHYGHAGSGYGQPGYGYGESGHGHGYGGGHGYGAGHGYGGGHGHGYPTYVLKVKKPGHGHDGTKVYAPNQVYNVKHKSKIVVRKNKHGKQKSAAITEKGFIPSRDNRGFSQSLLSPNRIRQNLQNILHLTPQNGNSYGYPTDEYGRPIYDYGRPNYDYGRPGITNQNQFGVPNQNQYYYPNGANQYGFQNPGNQNVFQNTPNRNEFQNLPGQNGFQNPPSQNGFPNYPSQVGFPTPPPQNEFPNTNGNDFQNPPNQNGFQDQLSQNEPNQNNFPNRNDFPDNPNSDLNSETPKESKENEGTLIVIPGNADRNEGGLIFGGPTNTVVFPDTQDELKLPGFTQVTEQTPEATTETPKATESTRVTAPELPPLTPVSTDSRNNFNFGPSGIFHETCTTVENEVGSCLPVDQCQPYLKLIQESRSNPKALQILRKAHCGFQGNNPKVCCPRPGFSTGPPPTLPPPTLPPSTEAPVVTPEQPEQPEPSAEPKHNAQLEVVNLPEAPVCGVSNASFSRVVGGIPAKLGDFPWMALLGYKERRTGAGARWLCGGSLISSRHVLTAAHCIHTRENELYLVRLGELDLARDDEGATPVDVLIKTLVKHEEYSPKSFTNDIGILVLSRDVQYTSLIQPICIPRSGDLRSRSYENYTPLIAGWGDTEFRGPSATHLQVLQLPVVSNEYCAQAYSGYKAQVIDQRVLCAGFKKGGKDACQGDSGGPLMQPIYNSDTRTTFFYQIGVVSYGKKCAEAGFPGVYTRVTNFVPWIEETVANN